MPIAISPLIVPSGDALDAEMVERKGLGHPNTICDALSEALSLALSRHYRDRFGRLFHHNVDKSLLWGGSAAPAFGGGRVIAPTEIFLAGRATTKIGRETVSINAIARRTVAAWFGHNMPALDPRRHVRVHDLIRPGSIDLVELFDRQGRKGQWLCNGTSIGVGYAPLSRLERVVDAVERGLTAPSMRQRHPEIGADVKVMGVRQGSRIRLTAGCAFVGRHIADMRDYVAKKRQVAQRVAGLATRAGAIGAEIVVNAADAPRTGEVYLTVTGTSAESGDDGEAGRGNRPNGLITPFRPTTMESLAGKNPITHVGKLYNLAAGLIAETIVECVPAIAEAECYLVSAIGQPVGEPQLVELRLRPQPRRSLRAAHAAATEIARAQLAHVDRLWLELLDGRLAIGRWPLRRRHGEPA